MTRACPPPAAKPEQPDSHLARRVLAKSGEHAYVLEECRISRSGFVPAIPENDPYQRIRNVFVMVLSLEGSTVWRRRPEPVTGGAPGLAELAGLAGLAGGLPGDCTLEPHHFVAYPCEPGLAVARTGNRAGHFLLWRARLDAMQAVDSVLGMDVPPAAPATPATRPGAAVAAAGRWPLAGPFPSSPDIRALVASLRLAPGGPMRSLWFGAKLIELIALLHPASARLPEADGEGGGKARGKAGGKAGGERGFCLHPSVERALRHIEVSFCKPLSLDEIAAQAAVTPGYLSHLFAIEVGETLSSYLRRVRMKHAARLLGDGKCNVSEAAKAVGYASIGQFSHAFRDHFGYPPGQHVHRGAGVR